MKKEIFIINDSESLIRLFLKLSKKIKLACLSYDKLLDVTHIYFLDNHHKYLLFYYFFFLFLMFQ